MRSVGCPGHPATGLCPVIAGPLGPLGGIWSGGHFGVCPFDIILSPYIPVAS